MPVTLLFGESYASSITLYAETITVSKVGYNRQIPIRDIAISRTRYPVFINLGYTGETIKLEGFVDPTTYSTLITFLPDISLKTSGEFKLYTVWYNG